MHHLETSRCKLAPFPREKVELFHAINVEPFVRRYLWDDLSISLEMAQELLHQNELLFDDEVYGLWAIRLKEREEVAGYVGLWFFFAEPQPQLIYALRETYSGQGLATECANRIVDYAFAKLKFDYLLAATDAPHVASQHVAERLGMRLVEKRIENGKETWFYRIERQKK